MKSERTIPVKSSGMSHKRVGFFSGTFDPIHVGHIEFVLQAIKQANLEKVYVLIEEAPREKTNVTDIKHRKAMLQLAIQPYEGIELLTLPAKTFTVPKTLPIIQKKAGSARLAYLCGSDIVRTFAYRWPGLEQLTQSTDILIGLRTGEDAVMVHKTMHELGDAVVFQVIESPKPHLASTTIRNGAHQIDDVAPEVADYIRRNNLYS